MVYKESDLRSPQDIVDAFATHFKSVFVDNTASDNSVCNVSADLPDCSSSRISEPVQGVITGYVPTLHNFNITEGDILVNAKKLKPNLTMGPDYIPAFFVKDCATCLCKPLSFIYNLILLNIIFPTCWKSSKVCPVFKSGSKCDVENYRPIAIISNYAKLFESILSETIYCHISGSINTCQHGFVKNRSTTTNLCEMVQSFSQALDRRSQVDVIYTDFAKAFDRVDHSLLLTKLNLIGLSANLLKLFKSILCDQTQFVEYKGVKSDPYKATSGVTQGSNLGPIIF